MGFPALVIAGPEAITVMPTNFFKLAYMKRLFIFLLVPCLAAISAKAQQGIIHFEKTIENIGRVPFPSGSIEQVFSFFIAGVTPVVLTQVETDCACSIASFPTDTLQPGSFGEIRVVYSPYKPGPFEKRFTVIAKNAVPEKTELMLEGFIEPQFIQPEVDFPITMGSFRFASKKIMLGTITNEAPVKKTIAFYNHTASAITLSDSTKIPSHIEIAFESERTIPAQGVGKFTLYYHPELKNDLGAVIDQIVFFDKQTGKPTIILDVTATIRSYFPPAKGQEKSPKLYMSSDQIQLGKVNIQQQNIVTFTIENTGAERLLVLKIVANEGWKTVGKIPSTLGPGQQVAIQLEITDLGYKGQQERVAAIYTNDPQVPVKKMSARFDAY
jgi:hypothetical protein